MKIKLKDISISEIIIFGTVLVSFLFKLMDWFVFHFRDPSQGVHGYLVFVLCFHSLILFGMIIGAIALFKEKDLRKKSHLKLGLILNLLMFVIILIL